jgi:hypothetical protein
MAHTDPRLRPVPEEIIELLAKELEDKSATAVARDAGVSRSVVLAARARAGLLPGSLSLLREFAARRGTTA